jgi:hypothetical protein
LLKHRATDRRVALDLSPVSGLFIEFRGHRQIA